MCFAWFKYFSQRKAGHSLVEIESKQKSRMQFKHSVKKIKNLNVCVFFLLKNTHMAKFKSPAEMC